MDSLRRDYDNDSLSADAPGIEAPPLIGQDERRMHVRAYNFWAKLLDGRSFPAIDSLDLDNLGDFGPNAVLLDFTSGIENPALGYVGESLAHECELGQDIQYIADVPRRSLLSRLTDHYLQIIANRAPIGFEAEFVNSRGATILYRGVLLPFSSDDDTIDFILGVINWKQAAEPELIDALAEEMAAAANVPVHQRPTVPVWADGPESQTDQALMPSLINEGTLGAPRKQMVISREDGMPTSGPVDTWPVAIAGDDRHEDEDVLTLDTPLFDPSNASLADWLASARDSADSAAEANARGHAALYQAIGRAWGFAIAAQSAPADYQDLLDEAGISLSNRSPMTPVVKLVFGANHDKTRLAEYAAVLSHAAQKQIEADRLASYLATYQGGLKALLKDIRRSGRAGSAETATTLDPEAVLRAAQIIGDVDMSNDADDSEFIVLIARREIAGTLSVVAQLPKSEALTSKALKLAAKGLCV
jgi:hypothetical protein